MKGSCSPFHLWPRNEITVSVSLRASKPGCSTFIRNQMSAKINNNTCQAGEALAAGCSPQDPAPQAPHSVAFLREQRRIKSVEISSDKLKCIKTQAAIVQFIWLTDVTQ
ncbi:hypothetical protein Y1Q_0023583 [Alligator mississippiensis]|uniref:Uncharacterized protein n=1 Tax=Alligator mississippiensis TaxID=8496 RepID=A0A151MMU9_ALLMI|nr:hypothetical protein Y1Q_0023583 [Alligator mississippiensis]